MHDGLCVPHRCHARVHHDGDRAELRVATHSISHRKLHPDVWTHPTSPQLNRGAHKINQQITPASWALAVFVQGSCVSLTRTLLRLWVAKSWGRKQNLESWVTCINRLCLKTHFF